MYGMADKQRDGIVQSELLCGGRQGWRRCDGEGAFDVQGRDEALHADRSAINILRTTEILSTFTMFNC